MRLALNGLSIGSKTADEKLLEQLGELGQKLDMESDELLQAFSSNSNSDEEEESEPVIQHFGVLYVRDLDTDQTVGYLKYHPNGQVFRIDGFYVEHEYRRHCIGFILMRAFYEICREMKAEKINLGCIATNKTGIAFYKNEGYRISDATYILDVDSNSVQKSSLKVKERKFTEEEFKSIWKAMTSFLDKKVNLPEEVEYLYSYYAESRSLKPFSICRIESFDCAFLVSLRDSELYLVASSIPSDALTEEMQEDLGRALMQYAKKKKMKKVCIADIHLPSTLDGTSSCWKPVGYTFFKMAEDLLPKKSKMKI